MTDKSFGFLVKLALTSRGQSDSPDSSGEVRIFVNL